MSWVPIIHHVLGIDCPSCLGCLLCLGYLLSLCLRYLLFLMSWIPVVFHVLGTYWPICLGYLLSLCLGYLLSLMFWVPRVPYVLGAYLLGQADSGLLPWVRCVVMKEDHRQNLASRVLLESLDNTMFLKCVGNFIRFPMKIQLSVSHERTDLAVLEPLWAFLPWRWGDSVLFDRARTCLLVPIPLYLSPTLTDFIVSWGYSVVCHWNKISGAVQF